MKYSFILPNELINYIIKNGDLDYNLFVIIVKLNKTIYNIFKRKDIKDSYLNYFLRLRVMTNSQIYISEYLLHYRIYERQHDFCGRVISRNEKELLLCHRDPKNGCAYIHQSIDGYYIKTYKYADRNHNNDGPAIIKFDPQQNTYEYEYYRHGKLFRKGDKPVRKTVEPGKITVSKFYMKNDMYHRDDLGMKPSVVYLQRGIKIKEFYIKGERKICFKHKFQYICGNMRDLKIYYYHINVNCKTCSFTNECYCFRLCKRDIEKLKNKLSFTHQDLSHEIVCNITKHKNYNYIKCHDCEPSCIRFSADENKFVIYELFRRKDGTYVKTYNFCPKCYELDCDSHLKRYYLERKNGGSSMTSHHIGEKKCCDKWLKKVTKKPNFD